MHPGPINRGVEIDSAVVDGKQSVILPQVTFGIAVRMAVMSIVAGMKPNPATALCRSPGGRHPWPGKPPRWHWHLVGWVQIGGHKC